jgi:photoactive yellow protein
MREQIEELREQSADQADQADPPHTQGADDLHPEAEVLLGQLDAASLTEAQERVRSLQEQVENLYREKEVLAEAGLMSSQEALDEIDRLQRTCDRLRSQSDGGGEEASEDSQEAVADILGIASPDEARALDQAVRRLSDRLDDLLDEKASLHDTLGVADAEAVLDLVDSMEEQLVTLYDEVEASRNGAPAAPSPPNGEAPAGPSAPSVADILGLSGPEEARALDQLVRRMSDELDRLRAETEKLSAADLTADSALQMIDNMEEQLVALYHAKDPSPDRQPVDEEALDALVDVLGVGGSEVTENGTDPLPALARRVRALLDEAQAALPDGTGGGASVRECLRELVDTVEGLRDERDARAARADRLDAIEDVLGISTIEEARDLTALVQNLDEQLQTLYAERQELEAVGLSSVEDAVDMIRSMEHQLQELYQEQEALDDRPLPEQAAQQDTFEQLQSLYKEQEKLKRALGVSDADDVIEMVEDLTTQLDDVYSGQEPAAADAPSPQADADGPSSTTRLTLDSMRHQLEVLYAERETLLRRGFEDAEDAVARVDDLEDQLQALREEHEADRKRLDQIERELGTTDASEIAERMAAASGPDWGAAPSSEQSAPSASAAADDDPFVEAAPSLLPAETLEQLDAMPTDDLDDLPVGALRLDDQGTIQALNEKGLRFPGLGDPSDRSGVVGDRLFERVPGTSNALFLGRFKNGVEQGGMDARFPYTFVTPGSPPTVFFVHLYRDDPDGTNWLLFQPA